MGWLRQRTTACSRGTAVARMRHGQVRAPALLHRHGQHRRSDDPRRGAVARAMRTECRRTSSQAAPERPKVGSAFCPRPTKVSPQTAVVGLPEMILPMNWPRRHPDASGRRGISRDLGRTVPGNERCHTPSLARVLARRALGMTEQFVPGRTAARALGVPGRRMRSCTGSRLDTLSTPAP